MRIRSLIVATLVMAAAFPIAVSAGRNLYVPPLGSTGLPHFYSPAR